MFHARQSVGNPIGAKRKPRAENTRERQHEKQEDQKSLVRAHRFHEVFNYGIRFNA